MSTNARRPTCDIKTNHLTLNEVADTSSEVEILSDMPVTKSVVERKQDIPDKGSEANSELFLDQLGLDLTGTIIVMLGRMWDVSNMIHCSAKADVAHNFLRLKEGSIYSVKKISVKPNKKEYQILKNDAYMLEFDGSTTIRKALVKADGFVRYSFQLQDFDGIESSDNKCCRLCDQFGRTNHLKTSSKNLDFHLANHRGQSIRVTLWGSLGDVLIEKKTKQTGVCPVILTATCPKKYNNKVYLSSTSSTIIYNNDAIPAIKALKKANSVVDQETSGTSIDLSQPRDGTLKNLPMWARNRKNDDKEGMELPFMWERHLYRLEVDVSDDIAQAIVIMLNETATAFVKCSADSLMDTVDESSKDHLSLPPALSNLIGTAHVMEIESHTYYEYGTFESFTCWQILPSEGIEESDSESEDSGDSDNGTGKKGAVETSAKKRKNRVEFTNFDENASCGSGRVGAKATDAIHAAHEKGKGYTHIPFCLDD
ncbi:reverse transcriptase domain-containing protein [Tanacetum coccineum]